MAKFTQDRRSMPDRSASRRSTISGLTKPAIGEANLSSWHFQEIVDSASDFVAIADADGRLQFLNNAGRKMAGLGESDDIEGTCLADYHHPRESNVILNIALSCAEQTGAWEGASILRGKHGKEIAVQETILAHKTPQGRVAGYSVIARDASGVPCREETPRAGAQLRSLLEAAPGAMVVANLQGQIVLVNGQAEKWLGFSRHELLGQAVEIRLSNLTRMPHLDELERHGLVAAIRAFAKDCAASNQISMEFLAPPDFPRLSSEAERSLYTVMLETVRQNHSSSQAARVKIHLDLSPSEIVLEIQNVLRLSSEALWNEIEKRTPGPGSDIVGRAESLWRLGGRMEICSTSSSILVRAALPLATVSNSTHTKPA